MSDTDFIPRWASPPGDTIKEALDERSLDEGALCNALGLSAEGVQALLVGSTPLTIDLADRLTELLGGSVEFWMTRDGQYHADVARVAADAWAQELPVREMTALGWLPPDIKDWVGRLDACLHYFDVKDVSTWQANQSALRNRTRFRSSQSARADDHAVAAWLRQSELQLSQVDCEPWDRDRFEATLPALLPLTRMADPRKFLPLLTAQCAEVGVAVGVIRALRGCPVSGAARRLPNGQPSIALSARHRSDDHFWFTFFHEAAHLVLHDSDALYLDEIELKSDEVRTPDEAAADRYAGSILVPPEYERALAAGRRSAFELHRLAREIGVSTGIVVGQLQHRGVLGYSTRLNRLKHRYTWDGTTLERA